MIRLGQLLKLAGVIDSGAEVKAYLETEPVQVNGEPEQRRGRQLRGGDVVVAGERTLRVVAGGPGQRLTGERQSLTSAGCRFSRPASWSRRSGAGADAG